MQDLLPVGTCLFKDGRSNDHSILGIVRRGYLKPEEGCVKIYLKTIKYFLVGKTMRYYNASNNPDVLEFDRNRDGTVRLGTYQVVTKEFYNSMLKQLDSYKLRH